MIAEVKGKLSPNCIDCGEQLSAERMRQHVEQSIARGRNPCAVPHGAIRCMLCVARMLVELSTDDETPADIRDKCDRIITALRSDSS